MHALDPCSQSRLCHALMLADSLCVLRGLLSLLLAEQMARLHKSNSLLSWVFLVHSQHHCSKHATGIRACWSCTGRMPCPTFGASRPTCLASSRVGLALPSTQVSADPQSWQQCETGPTFGGSWANKCQRCEASKLAKSRIGQPLQGRLTLCMCLCRYMLLLNVPGKGEEALISGTMFDGLQTKEAAEVEQPMFEQLGMLEAMKKPGAVTAAVNWYRWAAAAYRCSCASGLRFILH